MTGMEQLKAWTKANGLTQEALAAELGVTGQTVYYWFRGGVSPNAKHIAQIEQATQGAIPFSAWFPQAPKVRARPSRRKATKRGA